MDLELEEMVSRSQTPLDRVQLVVEKLELAELVLNT
jgi:hypothetical protein